MTPGDPRADDMTGLLTCLRDICLFRAGPQDLPFSPVLAVRLSALLIGLGVVGAWVQGVPDHQWPLRLGLMLVFLVGPPWLLLRLRGRASRFVQTLSAMAGVGVLYNVLALPLLMALAGGGEAIGRDPGLVLVAWVLLALTLWRVLVAGHVWRHALDLPAGVGSMLALGLFIAQVLVAGWALGGQA